MPRIKLKEQPFYVFCYKTSLKIRDINYCKRGRPYNIAFIVKVKKGPLQ
jgi:hypothetical protein